MSLEAILYGAFLGLSLAIGALASRWVRGLKDYYVAGGQMPWYLLCGTFIASNVSAGLFLGATNMTGRHGYTMWCSYFTTSIGYLFAIGVIGVLVKRLASRYEIYDFADIFAVRYPTRRNAIRVLVAIVLPLIYVPMLAAQFIALAAISASMFATPYEFVLLLVVAIVVLYTLMGGMLGVVWTDTFQFFVLLIGLIVAVPVGMGLLGQSDAAVGWSVLTADSPELFKWRTDDWRAYDVLGQFVWIFALAAQPHLITRFLTARDERTILKALPVCVVASLVIYASTVPIGLLGRVSLEATGGGEHVYIALAKHTLGPWVGTFVLIGIAAAALSTCSTILMVTAQALSRDVYQRWRPGVSDSHMVRVSRLCVLVIGLFTAILAFFRPLSIFWLVVLSGTLFSAIFFVPLVGGFFSRRATGRGALAAMITGGLAAVIVYAVNRITGSHWFISNLYGGLLFSWLAWAWYNYRTERAAEEDAVLLSIACPAEGHTAVVSAVQ